MDDKLLILLREALLNTFLSLFLSRYSLFSSYSASNCFCVYPDTFYYPLFPPIVVPAAWMLSSSVPAPAIFTVLCILLISTFLNTKGSSLYAGFSPLFITIRVRNSLRMVSVGSPYMSTSTYVPIFLSDKNCPEKT